MSITYHNSIDNDVTEFYQWGIFQGLKIDGVSLYPLPYVLFSNGCCNETISSLAIEDYGALLATVPNEVLEDYGSIVVHVCQEDGHGGIITVDRVRIPVLPRPKPGDYDEIIAESQLPGAVFRLGGGRLDENVLG